MKTYVKPELFYESFELNYNVASCSVPGVPDTDGNGRYNEYVNSTDGNRCSFDFSVMGAVLFSGSACPDKFEENAEYCYKTGTAAYNFFSS